MKMKKRFLAAFLSLSLILSALALYAGADDPLASPFDDVRSGSWYESGAVYTFLHGYMSGTSLGRFSPDDPLTRAMAVQILARVCGARLSDYSGKSTFPDVPANCWFHDAVEWAYENGITRGTGFGAFDPYRAIRREELITMLYGIRSICPDKARNAMEEEGPGYLSILANYYDAGMISGYAVRPMAWAVRSGIIDGNEKGELLPATLATRAQTAVMIRSFERVLGHSWGQAATVKARTCTQSGTLEYTCSGCGAKMSAVLPAYHSYQKSLQEDWRLAS